MKNKPIPDEKNVILSFRQNDVLFCTIFHNLSGKFRRSLHIRLVWFSLVDAFEFALAVKLSLIHLDADLVCLRLHFFVGGIKHGGGTKVDDPANRIFIQSPDKIPHLRVNAEGIIRVSQKQDVYGICNGRADGKSLCSDRLGDRLGKSFRISSLRFLEIEHHYQRSR